jgi:hypothetical protein
MYVYIYTYACVYVRLAVRAYGGKKGCIYICSRLACLQISLGQTASNLFWNVVLAADEVGL